MRTALKARIPRRRHRLRHPRDDPREDVGVGVVECGLNGDWQKDWPYADLISRASIVNRLRFYRRSRADISVRPSVRLEGIVSSTDAKHACLHDRLQLHATSFHRLRTVHVIDHCVHWSRP